MINSRLGCSLDSWNTCSRATARHSVKWTPSPDYFQFVLGYGSWPLKFLIVSIRPRKRIRLQFQDVHAHCMDNSCKNRLANAWRIGVRLGMMEIQKCLNIVKTQIQMKMLLNNRSVKWVASVETKKSLIQRCRTIDLARQAPFALATAFFIENRSRQTYSTLAVLAPAVIVYPS